MWDKTFFVCHGTNSIMHARRQEGLPAQAPLRRAHLKPAHSAQLTAQYAKPLCPKGNKVPATNQSHRRASLWHPLLKTGPERDEEQAMSKLWTHQTLPSALPPPVPLTPPPSQTLPDTCCDTRFDTPYATAADNP